MKSRLWNETKRATSGEKTWANLSDRRRGIVDYRDFCDTMYGVEVHIKGSKWIIEVAL